MAYLKTKAPLKGFVDLAAADALDKLDFKKIQRLTDSLLVAKDTAQVLYALTVITDHAKYFTEGFALKFKLHLARKEWKPVEDKVTHALESIRKDAAKPSQSYLLTVQALVHAKNNKRDD